MDKDKKNKLKGTNSNQVQKIQKKHKKIKISFLKDMSVNPKKKSTVSNGKIKAPKSTFGEDQSKEIWEKLRDAIRKIHLSEACTLSFEELYRNAYNMILHKHGDMLYQGLQSVIKEYLEEKCDKLSLSNDSDFLKNLNEIWTSHTNSMILIRDILMYMDRTYITSNKLMPVYELGLKIFCDSICHTPKYNIRKRIQDSLLSFIKLEREGELVSKELIRTSLEMLVQIGLGSHSIYIDDFETPFLESTSSFYFVESQQYLSENNVSYYLIKIEKRLKEEDNRVESYLDPSTKEKLQKVCEKELISNHMKKLIEMESTGLVAMLEYEKFDDLSRMFRLFGRVKEGHDEMKSSILSFVVSCGDRLNEDSNIASDAVLWINEVMKMKEKYNNVLDKALAKDKGFQTCINDGFRRFISKNKRSSEFLSLYIDDKLKKGTKETSEEEYESILDKSIIIFRFLEEKDAFERFYKSHLAKRLLSGRSSSDESERSMIVKLKAECGNQFTSKLEGMFNDMKISEEIMKEFKEYKETREKPNIDLNVNVLTVTFWPMSSTKCSLPEELVACTQIFTEFYHKKYTGRKLTWQLNLGNADVKAKFDKKTHELSVTTPSMIILILFNSYDTLSFKEIKEKVSIPEVDLKRNLLSLSLGKYKILNKSNKSKEIEDTDEFSFNASFSNNLVRIKIPLVVTKQETETEPQEMRERIEEERQHMIEACIVRVMKSRKQLDHNSLVIEVTKQLSSKFHPNPNFIKKRIEALIDREFLVRSKEDIRTYLYVA